MFQYWQRSAGPGAAGGTLLVPAARRVRLRRALQVLPVLFAIAIVVGLLARADLSRLRFILAQAGARLALAPLPYLGSMVADALAWGLLLRQMGPRVKFWQLLRVRLATEALLLALPGGAVIADLASPILLRRHCGVPLPEAAASVAVRKGIIVSSDAAYMAMGLLGGALPMPSIMPLMGASPSTATSLLAWLLRWGLTAGIAFNAAVGGFLLLALGGGAMAERLRRLLARLPVRRLADWAVARMQTFARVDDSARRILRGAKGVLILAFCLYLAQWIFEALDTYVIASLSGIHVPFMTAWRFEALSSFLRSAALFLPAGLGIQDTAEVILAHATGTTHAATAGAALFVTKRTKECLWIVTGLLLLSSRKRDADADQPGQI
jgi:uncharacterized membrane protein YbhN (UPF0104 family)